MRRLTQLVLASSCLIASLPYSAFGAVQNVIANAVLDDATGGKDGVVFDGAGNWKLTVPNNKNIGSVPASGGVSVLAAGAALETIIFQGSSTVTGSITATGNTIDVLELQGGAGTTVILNGKTVLTPSASEVNFTTLAGASLYVKGGDLLMGAGGKVDFGNFGLGSTITFADSRNFDGEIDTKVASTGTVVFEGSSTVTNGLLGANNKLLAVQLGSGTVYLDNGGNNKATDFQFTSNTGANTLKLSDATEITGNIDNISGTSGRGTILFEQDGTVTGNIGATSPVSLIRMSDNASTVILAGNVNANTIQLGNTVIGTDNTLKLTPGGGANTVNANIITSADQVGIVNIDGVTTFTGDIGSSSLRLKQVLVGTNNDTTINGNIYVSGGVKFGGNNTLTIADGNFINGSVVGHAAGGKLVFAGSSQSYGILGVTNKLTSVSFNGGTYNLSHDINVNATGVTVKGGATLVFSKNATSSELPVLSGPLTLDATGANLQVGSANVTTDNKMVKIDGDLTTATNSVISIDLNSPDVYSQLKLTGAGKAQFLNAPIFDISTSGYIPNNSTFNIVAGSGAVQGGPGTLANKATLLSNFALAVDGNNIKLTVTRNTNTSLADYPFTTGIAGALDVIQNTPALIANPEIFAVVNQLDNFTNRESYNRALATLAPSVDGDNFEGMMSITRLGVETIRQRLDNYRLGQLDYVHTGYAAGSYDSLKDYGVWVKLLASRLKQSEYKGVEGYKSDVWGITGGIDYTSPDNVVVYGLGFNYTTTESLSRTAAASKNDISSYSLMLYGTYNFENPWYLDGIAYFTQHNYEQTRNISAGTTSGSAKADYAAWQISARAETGFVYQYNKVLFQPILGLFYSHIDRDDYTETGAGGLNLVNRPKDLDSLRLSIGPKISSVLGSEGASIIPELHAYYNYELLNTKEQYISNFVVGGPTFVTPGIEPKRSSYVAGVALAAYGFENVSCHISLDYEFNDTKFAAWHGSMKFKYTW